MNKLTSFEDHLKKHRGAKGSEERAKFDADSLAFRLGVMLQEARKEAKMTQEQLAEKTGTKKSYISRIETGKSDIQLSTFYKLIEIGLGKSLNISIG
jgi:DNA-binding XRE family transcriptional regulator